MVLWSALLWTTICFAEKPLTVFPIFSDNAVLQCEKSLPIWGECSANTKVVISLNNDLLANGMSDNDGHWTLQLPAQNASFTPKKIHISTKKDTLILDNILFGEVWLASGQSNMEYPINKAIGGESFLAKEQENIRVLRVPHKRGLLIDTHFESDELEWQTLPSNSSAVAAFFAADIQQDLQRPIGILQCTWGGTNCETWTPLASIEENSQLKSKAEKLHQAIKEKPADEYEKAVKAYDSWVYENSRRKKAGEPALPAPKLSVYNPQSKNAPSSLYKNMIAPFQPFSIRGVLWYQGESNAFNHEEYYTLFSTMIKGWREGFQQDNLPFLFVQLPSYSKNFKDMRLTQAQVRDSLSNVEMVCAIDCGEKFNGHPKDKRILGERLSQLSLYKIYKKDVIARGPLPKQVVLKNKQLVIQYEFVGDGLISNNKSIIGFEVAGKDDKYVPINASIVSNDKIVIDCKRIKKPKSVRYAYVNWPNPPVSLYNSVGLPAEPFINNTVSKQ